MRDLETFDRLLRACETRNLDAVRSILDTGFNVNTFDENYVTPLQMAAAHGDIDIVGFLLDRGANVEQSNQIGMTPLHHAARNGHCSVVRMLVQRRASFDKLTYYGASPLTLAAAGGHEEVVQLLIYVKAEIDPQMKYDTALCPTPVMASIFKRHPHICLLLAQRGANLDDTISRLWNLSAMSLAITCNATAMVGKLLELKASSTFRSLGNRKPRELAIDLKRVEILGLIENFKNSQLERRFHEIDLRELILNRDEIAVRRALHSNWILSFPEGCTPLMYAVVLADIYIVKAVREETSDVAVNAAEDVLGLTALMFASVIGNNEMVEYLLSNGANIRQTSHDGLNALDYAFNLGSLDARTLCMMQHQLDSGSLQPLKTEFHYSGGFSSMTKIFKKVGFGSSGSSLEQKERTPTQTEHIENLLNACASRNCSKFATANDILRSAEPGKAREKIDHYHKRVGKIRHLAEISSKIGFTPLPIWFTTEDSDVSEDDHRGLPPDLAPILKTYSGEWQKEKEYFSLAQKNADIFSENRVGKGKTVDAKTRRVFEQYERRKTNSSTSASGSEGKSFRRAARSYSSLQHISSSVLRTTPGQPVRSRENINSEEYDGRTSPSRRSLNQYTFSLKNEQPTLRKSTSTSALDLGSRKASSAASGLDLMQSFPLSKRTPPASVKTRKKSAFIFTIDYIWQKLEDVGLGKYIEVFKQNEVDDQAFMILTETDLITLVPHQAHREAITKIMRQISNERKRR